MNKRGQYAMALKLTSIVCANKQSATGAHGKTRHIG
jgi:hypothetical protein